MGKVHHDYFYYSLAVVKGTPATYGIKSYKNMVGVCRTTIRYAQGVIIPPPELTPPTGLCPVFQKSGWGIINLWVSQKYVNGAYLGGLQPQRGYKTALIGFQQ